MVSPYEQVSDTLVRAEEFLCVKERRMYARMNGSVFLIRTTESYVRRNDLSRRGTAVSIQLRDSTFLRDEKEQVRRRKRDGTSEKKQVMKEQVRR